MEVTHSDLKIYNKPTKNMINELLIDIYLSNLSIEEYCSNTGYPVYSVKAYCKKYIKSKDLTENRIGSDLLNRNPKEFLLKLKNDVLCNLQGDDIDILDYLKITRLQSRDFREILSNYLSTGTIIDILTLCNLKRLNPASECYIYDININRVLNAKISFNGVEASYDDKIKIFNFLDENNYPKALFYVALKKYLDGNLDIDGKKYIKH